MGETAEGKNKGESRKQERGLGEAREGNGRGEEGEGRRRERGREGEKRRKVERELDSEMLYEFSRR